MAFTKTSKLDRRIQICEKKLTKDVHFQPLITYEPIYECWAGFQTQYLRDMVATIGTVLENTVTFIVRYDQKRDITRDLFILFEGVTYEIISVNKGQWNRDFTVLVAKEVSNG